MIADSDFRLLLEHYHRSWQGYRKVRKSPMKRIGKHMESLGCSAIEEYLDGLDENRAERETLLFFLRITISRFFRYRKLWTSLADSVSPFLLKQNTITRLMFNRLSWTGSCSHCFLTVFLLSAPTKSFLHWN
jgi:chemotaxis methyl-accepting protein methylase